ncbi:unnamed protein product [Malus baccata var. baccata]
MVQFVQGLYSVNVQAQLEGNASLVLAVIKGQGDDRSNFGPIINDLRCFCLEWSKSTVNHVQREGNSAAHRLARLGLTCTEEIVWFEEPPDLIQDILLGGMIVSLIVHLRIGLLLCGTLFSFDRVEIPGKVFIEAHFAHYSQFV